MKKYLLLFLFLAAIPAGKILADDPLRNGQDWQWSITQISSGTPLIVPSTAAYTSLTGRFEMICQSTGSFVLAIGTYSAMGFQNGWTLYPSTWGAAGIMTIPLPAGKNVYALSQPGNVSTASVDCFEYK